MGNYTYVVEAKYVHQSTESPNDYLAAVPDRIEEAFDQVSVYDEFATYQVAAVFYVPAITGRSKLEIAEVVSTILSTDVGVGNRLGLRSDYYPVASDDPEKKEWRYPGVTLFLAFRKA